jgi:protein-tyrosine-phosphatase
VRLLFVCTGNCFRSPAAEALTRLEHPDLEVESAGTDAVDFIAEPTVQYLERHGALRYVKPEPDQLSERAVEEADLVVCMMPVHAEYLQDRFGVDEERIAVWNIRDGIYEDVDAEEELRRLHKKVEELEA